VRGVIGQRHPGSLCAGLEGHPEDKNVSYPAEASTGFEQALPALGQEAWGGGGCGVQCGHHVALDKRLEGIRSSRQAAARAPPRGTSDRGECIFPVRPHS